MAFTSPTLRGSDVRDVSTVKQHVIGARSFTADGRMYRYCKNGSVPLAANADIVSSTVAPVSTTLREAATRGERKIEVSTNVGDPKNLEDGIATINGSRYLVGGALANNVVTLQEGIDIPVAKSAAVKLQVNKFCSVVAQSGSTVAIGTTEVAVPANAYFWALVSF